MAGTRRIELPFLGRQPSVLTIRRRPLIVLIVKTTSNFLAHKEKARCRILLGSGLECLRARSVTTEVLPTIQSAVTRKRMR